MKIYLVGGAIRDRLLGRAVGERDWVVVGATPEAMVARGFKPVGKDFPVFLHPESHEEYALARTERKSAPGYHGFVIHASPEVTLEEDLRRRDLTVNAMAEDDEGNLIDLHGGRDDLERRVLRHISPAFAEDPVRILRLARFAARYASLGFRVAEETLELMREMVRAGEVDALVAERVWREWERALGEPTPGRFIQVLRDCGALARLLPELDHSFHPPEESGLFSLRVLERAVALSSDRPVRLAALLGRLQPEQVVAIANRLKLPKEYRELARQVAQQRKRILNADQLSPSELLALLQELDALRRPERLEPLLTAIRAEYELRHRHAPSSPRPSEEIDHPPRAEPGGVAVERDAPFPGARLQVAQRAAATVSAAPLLERGLRGRDLARALDEERSRSIERAE